MKADYGSVTVVLVSCLQLCVYGPQISCVASSSPRARLLSGVKDFEKEGEGFGSHVGDFDFSIDGLFQRMLEHGQENGTASRQNVPMSFELLSKLK